MEHLLQWSKCSIFHNISKDIVFQRCQKALSWSNWLTFVLGAQNVCLSEASILKVARELPENIGIHMMIITVLADDFAFHQL